MTKPRDHKHPKREPVPLASLLIVFAEIDRLRGVAPNPDMMRAIAKAQGRDICRHCHFGWSTGHGFQRCIKDYAPFDGNDGCDDWQEESKEEMGP